MVRSLDRSSTQARPSRSSTVRDYNVSTISTTTTVLGGDPFDLALAPPTDETSEQREFRIQSELEAKRVSDEIDETLKAERIARAKNAKKVVRVLLLGQSESGKSTTVKNFQLRYSPQAWHEREERSFWRAVVQLNLVRSIMIIVDILDREITRQETEANLEDETHVTDNSTSQSQSLSLSLSNPGLYGKGKGKTHIKSIHSHRSLIQRLSPLRGVQQDLERRLGNGSLDPLPAPEGIELDVNGVPFAGTSGYVNGHTITNIIGSDTEGDENENENDGDNGTGVLPMINPRKRTQAEFSVHSTTGWKGVLDKWRQALQISSSSPSSSSSSARAQSNEIEREAERITNTITQFRENMFELWNDGVVRSLLDRLDVRLDDSGGFFLNDITRITDPEYMPSDDDIIRARLRTVGVQEYHFTVDSGRERGTGGGSSTSTTTSNNTNNNQTKHEWILYDVGGTRTLRQAWSSFFNDVHAILFLAPISSIDETLLENARINRLEDTFLLWRYVCSNKLLIRVQLVLFLNKCDLLMRKLERGLKVKEFIPSFRERENEFIAVAKYFKIKFREMLKQYSPEPRPFYCYLTSVIDTKATNFTLQAVQEGILREHLRGNIV